MTFEPDDVIISVNYQLLCSLFSKTILQLVPELFLKFASHFVAITRTYFNNAWKIYDKTHSLKINTYS